MSLGTPPTTSQLNGPEFDWPKSQNASATALSFQERCSGLAFAAVLQQLSATWRVDYHGLEILDGRARSTQRHIVAFWHRHYITLFPLFRHRPIVAITNRSHRGKVIANICQRSGMRSLQVPEKGTKRMLESLKCAAAHGLGLAIAVDGPLGPACEVKRAVLHLAARLQCPIVPVAAAASSKRVFSSRWDRLEIPHLFTRVSYVIGSPINVASANSRAELGELGLRVKQAIECGTHLAQQRVNAKGRD